MKHFEMKTLEFLTKLRKNNNRDWFQANKDNWTAIRNDAKSFLAELETEMNKSDVIESVKLFRINRDIRFSKDKTPYNTHISMSMKRAGAFRRGGYYLKIKPGENFMAAGFWGPETSDLKLIRAQLELDARYRANLNKLKPNAPLFYTDLLRHFDTQLQQLREAA